MKKFTKFSSLSLFLLTVFTSMLFFSSCSTQKQHFSFTPAPPAYVKKQAPAVVNTTAAAAEKPEINSTPLIASKAQEKVVVLPEVAALKEKTQLTIAKIANAAPTKSATAEVRTSQKLTLAQKIMLHKIQKQAKRLSNQEQHAGKAAGPVSNRNAVALILIGLIAAVLGSFLGGFVSTLGVLILLVGLVLLVLNYI